jgi:hypothetical protein
MNKPRYNKKTKVWTLVGGQKLKNVHAEDKCLGEYCCIHNPSNHSMRAFPMNYRPDRGIMERICPCGIGHPDPDDPTENKVHGCCGKHCGG